MTEEREFLERIALSQDFFVCHVHVHASRNLSNNCGKQRNGFSTTKTVGVAAEEFQILVEEKLQTELIITCGFHAQC